MFVRFGMIGELNCKQLHGREGDGEESEMGGFPMHPLFLLDRDME